MYSGAIQFLAIGLFATCLYHSWKAEGRKHAQQWFAVGYLFALLRELLLVQLRVISYSDRMLQFGGAPTLTSLLMPALFYLAYAVAGRLHPANPEPLTLYLMFLLTPVLALPVDATASSFDWWSFPSPSHLFLNGIPYFVPLAWGSSGALFYGFVRFVRRIPLRGNGQLFALILGAPLIAGLSVLLVLLAQFVVALLGSVQSDLMVNILLGALLLALPAAYLVGVPRWQTQKR
jgi:hypothetical protein